jgi:hypothetical protein
MEKHSWEVLSISLEYFAFFLAAPDFLGEQTLTSVKALAEKALKYPDRFFKWAGDKIRKLLPIFRDVTSTGGFILAVVGLDIAAIVYFGIAHLFFGKPFTLEFAQSHSSQIFVFIAVANFGAVLYAVHMLIHWIASLGGKGMFFLAGAITFTISKAIAIAVALEYLGSH